MLAAFIFYFKLLFHASNFRFRPFRFYSTFYTQLMSLTSLYRLNMSLNRSSSLFMNLILVSTLRHILWICQHTPPKYLNFALCVFNFVFIHSQYLRTWLSTLSMSLNFCSTLSLYLLTSLVHVYVTLWPRFIYSTAGLDSHLPPPATIQPPDLHCTPFSGSEAFSAR